MSGNSDPPLNYSDKLDDFKIHSSGLMAVDEDSEIGLLTIVTTAGYCDFLIDQKLANQIVQQLRQFIRGDSKRLPKI